MLLLKTNLGRLRLVAFLEGVSFLLLLGVAMPLKYWANMPIAVKITGTIHGWLFILYILFLVLTAVELRRSWLWTAAGFIASLIPFGTFYAEVKWFRPLQK